MAFETLPPHDGVYPIGAKGLEVLLDGIDRLDPLNPVVLVNFSADVQERATKTGPFFSGVNVAKALKLPLLAVADPSVTRDTRVSLGWYLGNEDYPDLVPDIVKMLDAFAERQKCRLILFGGSGGGFATLNILNRLTCEASAVPCNPQTSVAQFHPINVSQYLRMAWPSCAGGVPTGKADDPLLQEAWKHRQDLSIERSTFNREFTRAANIDCLAKAGIFAVATNVAAKRGEIIYLQNRTDWHVLAHACPLCQKEIGNLLARGRIAAPNATLRFSSELGAKATMPRQKRPSWAQSQASNEERMRKG